MMKSLLRHSALFILTSFLFCSTVSASVTQPASAFSPSATSSGLSPTVSTETPLPNKISASQLGIDLPITLGFEYIQGTGGVVDGQYTKSLNENFAVSLLGQYGSNLYRVNGTLGTLVGDNNLFKVTVEKLSEVLPFQFDSGSVNERVSQNTLAAQYQAGFDLPLIQAINAGGYYAKANGVSLAPIVYVSDNLSRTNYRNIAGSTSGGGNIGFISQLSSLTQLSANFYYDQVNYNTQLTSSSQYNSSGLGISAGLIQIINPQLQLKMNAEARAIDDSYQATLTWLPQKFSKYDVQFSLGAGHFVPRNNLPSSNNVGVQLGFSLEKAKESTNRHFEISNPSSPDLNSWTSKPAAYANQVLVVAEQKTVLSTPNIISITPASGPGSGGTSVTISGTGFTGATLLTFAGTSATFTVVNDSTITATTPAGSLGPADVSVTTPGGTGTLTAGYTYTTGGAAPPHNLKSGQPIVNSLSPTAGIAGTSVIITGSNFTGVSNVTFGGVTASSITPGGDSSVTATAPGGVPPGTVEVQVTTLGGGTSALNPPNDNFTYETTPVVGSFNPTSGSTAGGTSVVITGSGFTGVNTPDGVVFGAINAASYNVDSDTQITAVTPAESVSSVTIHVKNSAGTGNSSTLFGFVTPPVVTGVSPNTGTTSGGTSVTVTGTGFQGANTTGFVKFGTTLATVGSVASDGTSLTATSPAHSAGTVDITVANGGGIVSSTTSADQYTYVSPPTVTSLTPIAGSASVGTSVSITGTNFTSGSTVSFGGTPASSVTFNSATSLTATSPVPGSGTVDVTVTTVGGTSATSSTTKFTYGAPTVTSLTPIAGPTTGGTVVTITGTNFATNSTVSFGGSAGTAVTVNSTTSITATSPSGSGTVDVTVTTDAGTSATSSTTKFTYGAPTVTSLTPIAGPTTGGTVVTITGTNFSANSTVSFGGSAGTSVTVNSTTSITVTSPSGSGTVDVTVTTDAGTSATSSTTKFTYGLPTVTSLTPIAGPTTGSTVVTITGTNFAANSTVSFGGSAGTSVTVNSTTSITATSPSGSGTVNVTVTTDAGTSATSSTTKFTYGLPTVTSLTPIAGPTTGGTVVTITGTNFAANSTVSFGGSAGTGVTVNSTTSITATSPSGSGTVNVTVTTDAGTSATSSTTKFTYGAPTVTSLTPIAGPTTGGTVVTITGTNFAANSTVSFGGSAGTSVTVNSTTSITATSPSGSGTVNVTVTTDAGTSATSSTTKFTYGVPTVTGVSPTAGSTAGGTVVTITGTNFAANSTVSFGGSAGTAVTVNSTTFITATSPAGSGTVDVTVTTDAGTSTTSSSDKFTYGAPTVTGVSPNTGTTSGGTVVTITGTNFTSDSTVSFGGSAGTGVTVNSTTSITATAPAHSTATVDVTVTNPVGTSATSSADEFTYAILPTVTAISPNTGSTVGGLSVIITGTNFTGATSVKFGSTEATSFTINSATKITATSPVGSAGTVDITVTNSSGTSTTGSLDKFTYIAPTFNTVTNGNSFNNGLFLFGNNSVSNATTVGQSSTETHISNAVPSQGSAAGGTEIIIKGNGLNNVDAVYFGGTSAQNFTVINNHTIRVTTPAHVAGKVNINVGTSSGGTSLANGFSYQ